MMGCLPAKSRARFYTKKETGGLSGLGFPQGYYFA